MTDPDLVSRLRAAANSLSPFGPKVGAVMREAADALEARSGICKSCGEYSTLLSDLRSDPPAAGTRQREEAFALQQVRDRRLQPSETFNGGLFGLDALHALAVPERRLAVDFKTPTLSSTLAEMGVTDLSNVPEDKARAALDKLYGPEMASLARTALAMVVRPAAPAEPTNQLRRRPYPDSVACPRCAEMDGHGCEEHQPTKPAAVTVAPLKEFGCWQVLVDGCVVPELTVYAFNEARAVERAKAAVARKQET